MATNFDNPSLISDKLLRELKLFDKCSTNVQDQMFNDIEENFTAARIRKFFKLVRDTINDDINLPEECLGFLAASYVEPMVASYLRGEMERGDFFVALGEIAKDDEILKQCVAEINNRCPFLANYVADRAGTTHLLQFQDVM